MSSTLLIVGQGLAGTLLAWELERNGADFEIVDAPASVASALGGRASYVAAGIVNPVTGQRLAKSWRVEQLLPLARTVYQEMETTLGVQVWREVRVRRFFRHAEERERFERRRARGEFGAYVTAAADDEGFVIEGAAHLDVVTLLEAARRRWRASGRLRETIAQPGREATRELTVLCSGAGLRRDPAFASLPWTVAQGELLTVQVDGLAPDTLLNDGDWLLPIAPGVAKVGATYAVGVESLQPSAEARRRLIESAERLVRRPVQMMAHEVGLRLTLPDKRPVAGRGVDVRLGVCGGLGSKGALLAPWLARQWWNHLSEGVPFDPEIDVARWRR